MIKKTLNFIFAFMGIVFRQSVKTSIVTFSGAFLGGVIIWLSTNYFSKQQFGFTKSFTNWAVLACNILYLGTSNVLSVFIHKYDNVSRKRKLLITLCLAIPSIAIGAASVAYFFSKPWILRHFQLEDLPLMQQNFMWLPLLIYLFMCMSVLENYLGTQMKVAVSAFMREVVVRILTIILIALFATEYISFSGFVIGSILIYFVPVVIFLFIARNTKSFGFSLRVRDFTKTEYKEMIHFSWYHFLLVITTIFMSIMDAVMLPFYDKTGLSSVAVYSIAVFVIAFLQIPYKAMLAATFAVLTQAFTNNDIPKARDIFIRSSINILIATTGISLLIFCNLGSAVSIMKSGYGSIVPVFGILLIGRFIDLSTGMNDAVLTITNYYKFNVYISSVLIVLLYVLLRFSIPAYGVYGAAWSTTITLIIFNLAKYIFVRKKLGMQPYSKRTVLVIVAGLPALAAGYWLPHFFSQIHHMYFGAMLDAVVRSILIVIVYVAMLLWLKPSIDLEEYIGQIRKNKRLF